MELALYRLFYPLITIKNWTEYKKQLFKDSETKQAYLGGK